jgi:hypothetical protein
VFRDDILLDILDRQCRAAKNKPEEFDLMIGKAEKTVLLLTGHHWDDGLLKIATLIAQAGEKTPGNEKRLQAILDLIQSPLVKAKALYAITGFYQDERNALLDEITEIILSQNNEKADKNDDRHRLLIAVFSRYAEQGNADRMLEIVQSPRVPDTWKPELYFRALFGLWKEQLYYQALLGERVVAIPAENIDWPQWVENAHAISDPVSRFETYRTLVNWHLTDSLSLLDAMLYVAETGKDIDAYKRVDMFAETQRLARQRTLWDDEKTNDWLWRFDALLTIDLNAAERFRLLRTTINRTGFYTLTETRRHIKIDALLAAARDIPEQNPRARLNAFWETARQADYERLPNRAREVIDVALEYAGTISDHRVTRSEPQVNQLTRLLDQL